LKTDNTTAEGLANDTVMQNAPKRSTCAFTGFVTAFARNNFMFTGARQNSIEPTTSKSITPPNIIKTCGTNIYIKAIMPAHPIIMRH
jgi:hypothetical protein